MRDPTKERIWYLVENTAWRGLGLITYDIKSKTAVTFDLKRNERVINEEPLTMDEAKAFEKLLPKKCGVQS